ncbi:MAG: hypothetical protein AVDCRST_MAG77-4115 [uncultured Chloroflexi bacterium]|uniref:DUF4352 domain-containing protein n=1 Tax=uncultured Chloroflexota bacterium TaxID=166587 RepID=A0A6J4JQ60_9CHLR|nr:MAG: hypothetical protein AVDCRST_MAG77-4115 [uncultured Chloroflexota bacterium]
MFGQRGASLGSVIAAAVLVAGCGVAPVGTVDVEGTVQARVSATVSAASRAQSLATPTLTLGASAVTTIAVPTSLASPSAVRTPDVTPNPTAAASGSATARATGGPTGAATGAASGSATASGGAATATRPSLGTAGAGTAVPAGGTAAPASTPASLGTFARLAGLSATVSRYDWGLDCPGGEGRPRPGSKFVTLRVALRNDTGAVLIVPAVQWAVEGYVASSGAQAPCRQDDQQLTNACPRTQLPPGTRCDGWLLFEVPETLEIAGSTVQARADATGRTEIATWRLPA